MKKLLSILSLLTISGTAGIVGNAPAPEKIEINSLETNNLKDLNRKKRNGSIGKVSGHLNRRTIDTLDWGSNWVGRDYLYLYIDDKDMKKLISLEERYGDDKDALNNEIYRLIALFRNPNGVSQTDISTIATVFFNHFDNIKSVFFKNSDNGLIIRTNTVAYWSDNDEWWGAHTDSGN